MTVIIAPRIRTRLLALSNQEYRRTAESPQVPASRDFKALRVNPAKFDDSWDRKRGAAARLAVVLLREDAAALRSRACADPETVKTYAGAVTWLQQEAGYLRRTAGMLDTAVGRLTAVLDQCGNGSSASRPDTQI